MPGYTIEKILGRGGMGAVYRGVQTNLDRPVAIKILPPGVEKEDPSFAGRFKSEAKLMAKLNHPAVVAVYDFGTTLGGQLYFAMEYVDGSDVSQMIASQGRLPPEHALAITAHVCDALQAAHELGIVHRDIKPANVLLNMKGQVKVADFGLAKVEEPGSHGLTKTGYAMGTPDFVAPEALMLGTAIDGRADLYAVGVMLYQMITGNIPRGAFKPASVLVPGLDPRFDPIILKAMQHDRADRHQSAAELRRELDVILTVPFVRNDAPVSAAIPVAQVAQAPGQRSAVAQKPVGKPPQPSKGSAETPLRSSAPGGAAAKKPEAGKSARAPLLIGLGAAAAIGIGAFVMFVGKKDAKPKSSGAPSSGTSVVQASGLPPKPAAGTAAPPSKPAEPPKTTTASSPAASKPSEPQFPPGKWVKLFQPGSAFKPPPGATYDSDWMHFSGPAFASDLVVHNQGGRMVIDKLSRADPNGNAAIIQLRYQDRDNTYALRMRSSGAFELVYTPDRDQLDSDKAAYLHRGKLDSPSDAPVALEVAGVGTTLIIRLNGKLVATVKDTKLKEGRLRVISANGVKAVEVINLDGLSEAEALKILGVDEKGNDLRQPAAVTSSASTSALPAASNILPPSQPLSLRFPLTIPKLPSMAGDAVVFRLDGLPMTGSDAELSPPTNVHDAVRISAFDTKTPSFASVHAVIVRADGSAMAWGHDVSGCTKIPSSLKDVVDAAAAGSRTLLITGGGRLQYFGSASGRDLSGLEDGKKPVVSLQLGDGFDSVQVASGEIVSLRTNRHSNDNPLIKLGPLAAIARHGDIAAAVLPDGHISWIRPPGKASTSEPFLRGPFEHFRLAYLGGQWIAVAFDGKGPVGVHPENKAQLFTGMTEVVTNGAITAGRIGNDTWKFYGDKSQLDAAACEAASKGCFTLVLTAKYGFGIKTAAVIAEEHQAAQAEAMAAIPELKTLHEQFVKLQAERVTAPFEAELAKLNAGYVGGIDREIANEKKAGHLDGVIALEAEKKLIADKQPIPAEDDAATTEALKKLRGIYRAAYAKIEATRVANLKLLTDPLDNRLKQLEATLTQQDRIAHAKTVREYREGLGRAGSPLPAAATPQTVLGGPSALPLNPAAMLAMKDGFTNSLGMKFLPVKGTEVLFCIHEVRYSDYAAYAADSPGVDGTWKDQSVDGYALTENKENHPVTKVSWEDAQKFCAWLSKKEGKLYRLPTDEEWSIAVGLGRKEKPGKNITPAMLSGKESTEFPWGGEFPPKTKDQAGNYSDASRKAKAPIGAAQYLEDYDDGFPTTAPVMSFKPNKFGLYDMGGNVWEWCEDWLDAAQKDRVLRGSSWTSYDRGNLLSSCRDRRIPGYRYNHSGFRCVLVVSGG
jgi:serine/threonine protein kinase